MSSLHQSHRMASTSSANGRGGGNFGGTTLLHPPTTSSHSQAIGDNYNDPTDAMQVPTFATGRDGAESVVRFYAGATEEVRRLLRDECILIYECSVCRSLHRSINDFISHKRTECQAADGLLQLANQWPATGKQQHEVNEDSASEGSSFTTGGGRTGSICKTNAAITKGARGNEENIRPVAKSLPIPPNGAEKAKKKSSARPTNSEGPTATFIGRASLRPRSKTPARESAPRKATHNSNASKKSGQASKQPLCSLCGKFYKTLAALRCHTTKYHPKEAKAAAAASSKSSRPPARSRSCAAPTTRAAAGSNRAASSNNVPPPLQKSRPGRSLSRRPLVVVTPAKVRPTPVAQRMLGMPPTLSTTSKRGGTEGKPPARPPPAVAADRKRSHHHSMVPPSRARTTKTEVLVGEEKEEQPSRKKSALEKNHPVPSSLLLSSSMATAATAVGRLEKKAVGCGGRARSVEPAAKKNTATGKTTSGDTNSTTVGQSGVSIVPSLLENPQEGSKKEKQTEAEASSRNKMPPGPPSKPVDLSKVPISWSMEQKIMLTSLFKPLFKPPAVDGNHQCTICAHILNFRANAIRHIAAHVRAVRFCCSLCGAGAFFSADMRTHLMDRHCTKLHLVLEGGNNGTNSGLPCMYKVRADELTDLADPYNPGRVLFTSGRIVSYANPKAHFPDLSIEKRILGIGDGGGVGPQPAASHQPPSTRGSSGSNIYNTNFFFGQKKKNSEVVGGNGVNGGPMTTEIVARIANMMGGGLKPMYLSGSFPSIPSPAAATSTTTSTTKKTTVRI